MGRMRYGVAKGLEAEADALIAKSLQGVTTHEAKSDILTPWKEAQRRRREVYVGSGTPDPAVRQGMFHRRTNPTRPQLNSRDGLFGASQMVRNEGRETSLSAHVAGLFDGGE